MTNNGANDWDVSFSHIKWFENLLINHANVKDILRHNDLVFEVDRNRQGDHINLFCCNEYTMGLTMVLRALKEFGTIDLIYIGGGWCGYTNEAKDFCLAQKIGLYVSGEMSGALWADEYWAYHRKDK